MTNFKDHFAARSNRYASLEEDILRRALLRRTLQAEVEKPSKEDIFQAVVSQEQPQAEERFFLSRNRFRPRKRPQNNSYGPPRQKPRKRLRPRRPGKRPALFRRPNKNKQRHPIQSYSAPSPKKPSYGPPKQEKRPSYKPPENTGSYGAPQAKPQDSYGAPQAKPQDPYGAPQAKPQDSYGAPQAKPQDSYGAPQAKPQNSYGSSQDKPSSGFSYGSQDEKQDVTFSSFKGFGKFPEFADESGFPNFDFDVPKLNGRFTCLIFFFIIQKSIYSKFQ